MSRATSVAAAEPSDEVPCSPHPEAPHGFNRNASHSLHRYVCDCEGWEAPAAAAEKECDWPACTDDKVCMACLATPVAAAEPSDTEPCPTCRQLPEWMAREAARWAAEPSEDVLEVVFSHCESSGVRADPLLVADIVRATLLALRTAGTHTGTEEAK